MTMIVLVILMICIELFLLNVIMKSPFSYPYFIHRFDFSGRRSPHIEDFVDTFLISGGFTKTTPAYGDIVPD